MDCSDFNAEKREIKPKAFGYVPSGVPGYTEHHEVLLRLTLFII